MKNPSTTNFYLKFIIESKNYVIIIYLTQLFG